jgi:tetratricopeptide (TPR) repeat protein
MQAAINCLTGLLALLLLSTPVLAQDDVADLELLVRELLIAWDETGSTSDDAVRRYSDSNLDVLSELREALLLSRLARYSEPQKQQDYLSGQFLPFLERQTAELQAQPDVQLLRAAALRGLGRQSEALAIAADLPANGETSGDGYALWGALLREAGDIELAGKALDAAARFHVGNPLVTAELARQRLASGQAQEALQLVRRLLGSDAAAGFQPATRVSLQRLQAQSAIAAAEYDQAMIAAQAVLALHPNDAGMLETAARAAAARSQFSLAAEYQQQLCAVSPTAQTFMALAEYHVSMKDARAEQAFAEALRLEPKNTEALSARAAWLELSGQTGEAVADLRRLLELEPDNRDAARRLARLLTAAQPTAEGEAQLRQSLDSDPSPAAYLGMLELIKADPRRRQDYDNLFNDMLARYRNEPVVILAHARRLWEEQKYNAALEQFRSGAQLSPDNPAFAIGSGDCLLAMGGYTDAQEAYSLALRIGFDPLAVAGLALSQERSGDSLSADRTFRDQINAHPRDAALIMQYGLFLYSRTEYTAALEQYDLGRKLEPDNEMFVNRAALCLFQLNQIPEAIERLKAAINIRPRPLFYRNLAIAYEEQAEVELAEQYYREGIELFPADPQLLEGFSEFLEQQGRSPEALDMLARSVAVNPDTEVFMDLATLAEAGGNVQQARDAYESAIARNPQDRVINEQYCTFLASQKDNQALLAHLDHAVDLMSERDYNELIGAMTGFWIEKRMAADGALVLSQLIDLRPGVVRLYNSLALIQQISGDNAVALTTVRRGQRDAGESFLGLYLETLITWRSLGVEQARPLGEKLIAHAEADTKSWQLYLDMLSSVGDWTEEARVAALGLRKFFGDEQIYAHLVSATERLGDVRELIRVLEEAQYVRIRHEGRALLLGRSYVQVGNYVKALASLEPLLEQDGFNVQALQLCGEAHFMLGDRVRAREELTTALAVNPESAVASIWLGWVLLEDGDLAGAEQSLNAAEKSPSLAQIDLAWTRLGQATVAIRRGDRLLARDLLKQADALGGGDARFDSYVPKVRTEIQ